MNPSFVNLPLIVIIKMQVECALSPSHAIHSTSVSPIGNSDPEGGTQITSRSLPLMSLPDGSFHTNSADFLESVNSSRFAGQTGSEAFGMKEMH